MLGYQIESKERKYIMNDIANKELLLEAIDDCALLSKNQKKLLKILIEFDKETTADVLISISGLAKQVVYININKLVHNNFIDREKEKVFVFNVRKEKLKDILESYIKKQTLLKKRD